MKLYLALSCFQTRPMKQAWDDLVALGPDGIQLTPGCVPTPGFRRVVETSGVPVSFHHGFSWTKYRTDVWDENYQRVIEPGPRSVHPPKTKVLFDFFGWIHDAKKHTDLVYETMYDDYHLSSAAQLYMAMDLGLPLAVDVSHLYIQLCQGTMLKGHVKDIFEYENVREIHVSANNGKRDSHQPITADTFGLDWARERSSTIPVILECYMHKLSEDDRRRQMEILRG